MLAGRKFRENISRRRKVKSTKHVSVHASDLRLRIPEIMSISCGQVVFIEKAKTLQYTCPYCFDGDSFVNNPGRRKLGSDSTRVLHPILCDASWTNDRHSSFFQTICFVVRLHSPVDEEAEKELQRYSSLFNEILLSGLRMHTC